MLQKLTKLSYLSLSLCPLSYSSFLSSVFCVVHWGHFDYVALFCISFMFCLSVVLVGLSISVQVIDWKTRLRNDLQYVDENVKPCSLTPYGTWSDPWWRVTCQNMPVNQNPMRRVISDIHPHVTKSVIYSLQWFDTVGWVTGHPACKITWCSFVGGDDLTGDLHVL